MTRENGGISDVETKRSKQARKRRTLPAPLEPGSSTTEYAILALAEWTGDPETTRLLESKNEHEETATTEMETDDTNRHQPPPA